jgi:hypothetical protein
MAMKRAAEVAEVGSEAIDFICVTELRRLRKSIHNLLKTLAEVCGSQSPPYPLRVRAREALAPRDGGKAGGQA